jgi:hypothetical protein
MHKLLCLPLLAALSAGLAVPAASPDSASASAGYKECEFSKRKAKKRKAPVCAKDLSRSRWIVVSGTWRQNLTVHEETDGAVFDGTGSADFRAGGLSGASPFPSKKRPVVSMVSTKLFDHLVEFSASSQGGWTTTRGRFYDCSFQAPPGSEPNGFGGIFMLSGKNVRVQWPLGATGFGCGDGPYATPAPEWRTPVSTYPLKSFENRRLVRLPIAFSWTDESPTFRATNSYDGVGRLRRYR